MMAPSQTIPVLCHIEYASVHVSYLVIFSCSYLWFPGGWVPYLLKGCKLDFNNGLECDSNSGPVLALAFIESDSNNAPWATPTLCHMKSTYLFRSPICDFLVVTMTSLVT